jgi:hypothetical protein
MGADRDACGRFLPGRTGGPGRPRRAVESSRAGPPSDGTSRPPTAISPPISAQWCGAPSDGHWRAAVAYWPLAWRQRWAARSEALRAAGLPAAIAEDRAYRATVEEMGAV